MIKRTLFFGNPAYLSTKNQQLVVTFPEADKKEAKIPIEDLGYIVLEDPQITITNGLLMKLVENKTAVITCNKQHLPCSFLQPLIGHSEQTERIRHQLNASTPLKKNIWQQTISVKIYNQARFMDKRDIPTRKMYKWVNEVKSGDVENHESRSAVYYWQHIFGIEGFTRGQHGDPPNNLLNYGYAILRAVTARALIGSGLLPSIGVFHRNKYNAFCLADDIMEPYRPYVDALVFDIMETNFEIDELTTAIKTELLMIPAIDVVIDGKQSPLMVAMSRTSNSLYECFAGTSRKVLYPVFI
ncbi:type II CRISPR-associated endonuclease Cas1 [Algibacter sp. 2305UL17-15]|uniref:type II CRISPR-associated endonuclease Cas1 n=1 Tax=Algibacter sp. 2305UL17-15 TaxID=3231268 RepID=UPI003458F27D